jgi:hypothetical protein
MAGGILPFAIRGNQQHDRPCLEPGGPRLPKAASVLPIETLGKRIDEG